MLVPSSPNDTKRSFQSTETIDLKASPTRLVRQTTIVKRKPRIVVLTPEGLSPDFEKKAKKIIKRKLKKEIKEKELPFEEKIKLLGIEPKKIFDPERCHFFNSATGKQCNRKAVGSGVLCEMHGGIVSPEETTLSPAATGLYLTEFAQNSKYEPEFHPIEYINLSRQGKSEVEIAASFEVGLNTMRNWGEKFEQFAIARDCGKALYESWWLTVGKAGLTDARFFNTPLFKFLTGNKLGYSEARTESKNLNLNASGVLVVPTAQSEDEWSIGESK